MASAMGRIDALSYWVVSDHFEELGRPRALSHGGFGLRTVGELRKPRWWALALLERLGSTRLPVAFAGDGAGSLVEALATREDSGEVSVLAWNFTLDQTKAAGCEQLSRTVTVSVEGLAPASSYTLTHHRVESGDLQAWPDNEQWEQLRSADRLDLLQPPVEVSADDAGGCEVTFELPMPAISFLRLQPRAGG
jgi:xylan 1,4-beta-xylosidase